jgi:hypothetical protein
MHQTHCVMHAFAVVLTDLSCGDFGREIMFISNVRRLRHWMLIRAGRTILWVKEVLPSGLLLLEGKDGRECREHSKNCAPCHLSIEGTVHPELDVVLECLPCFVCGEKKRAATMLLCDQCQRGWHMACLRPPLTSLPSGQWSCLCCRGSSVLGVSTNRTQ